VAKEKRERTRKNVKNGPGLCMSESQQHFLQNYLEIPTGKLM